MEVVQGDLLTSGLTIREIDGEIGNLDSGETCNSSEWHGRVSVTPDRLSQLETGRRYHRELDDGRTGRIVISEMHVGSPGNKLVLQFDGTSSLK